MARKLISSGSKFSKVNEATRSRVIAPTAR